MKTSVLICAEREPTLLSQVVRELYFQMVTPEMLHAEAMGAHTLRIRLEVECDEWRLLRLLARWKEIVGVQTVVLNRLDGAELSGARP